MMHEEVECKVLRVCLYFRKNHDNDYSDVGGCLKTKTNKQVQNKISLLKTTVTTRTAGEYSFETDVVQNYCITARRPREEKEEGNGVKGSDTDFKAL